MRRLGYSRAGDLGDALARAEEGTALLAGGTELVNWLRMGVAAPERLLDIRGLPELDGIDELASGGLRIGAATTLADVASDPRVAAGWPALRESIELAASPQIRNRATLGGNLLQRTRCPYFRNGDDATPCNRRAAGSGCAALASPGSAHAILGWTEDCVATHPSDPAVALAALDARVVLVRAHGERTVEVAHLHRLPAESVRADTVLAPDEVVVAIELPEQAATSAYVKVRERASYEFATVSAAAAVETDGDTITRARVALGAVALRPWRLPETEALLVGRSALDAEALADALDIGLAEARAFPSNAFKVPLATNAAVRALRIAAGVEEGGG